MKILGCLVLFYLVALGSALVEGNKPIAALEVGSVARLHRRKIARQGSLIQSVGGGPVNDESTQDADAEKSAQQASEDEKTLANSETTVVAGSAADPCKSVVCAGQDQVCIPKPPAVCDGPCPAHHCDKPDSVKAAEAKKEGCEARRSEMHKILEEPSCQIANQLVENGLINSLLEPVDLEAAVVSFCASDCTTQLPAAVDSARTACAGVPGMESIEEEFQTASLYLNLVCNKDDSTYCFSQLVLDSRLLGLSRHSTHKALVHENLHQVCTSKCRAQLVPIMQEYGTPTIVQVSKYFLAMCSKHDGKYCAIEMEDLEHILFTGGLVERPTTWQLKTICTPCAEILLSQLYDIVLHEDFKGIMMSDVAALTRLACRRDGKGGFCIHRFDEKPFHDQLSSLEHCMPVLTEGGTSSCSNECVAAFKNLEKVMGCCGATLLEYLDVVMTTAKAQNGAFLEIAESVSVQTNQEPEGKENENPDVEVGEQPAGASTPPASTEQTSNAENAADKTEETKAEASGTEKQAESDAAKEKAEEEELAKAKEEAADAKNVGIPVASSEELPGAVLNQTANEEGLTSGQSEPDAKAPKTLQTVERVALPVLWNVVLDKAGGDVSGAAFGIAKMQKKFEDFFPTTCKDSFAFKMCAPVKLEVALKVRNFKKEYVDAHRAAVVAKLQEDMAAKAGVEEESVSLVEFSAFGGAAGGTDAAPEAASSFVDLGAETTTQTKIEDGSTQGVIFNLVISADSLEDGVLLQDQLRLTEKTVMPSLEKLDPLIAQFDPSLGLSGTAELLPSCKDGVKNQGEDRADCGGEECPPCEGPAPAPKVEQPFPTCFDELMNGNEDGVDCGGTCEKECPKPGDPGFAAAEEKREEKPSAATAMSPIALLTALTVLNALSL